MPRLAALLLGLTVALGAQGGEPPPANLVRLDVQITRDGVPERDLRIEELRVLEDDVEQHLESVRLVDGRDGAAGTMVVFVDSLHATLTDESRRALGALVDRVAAPQDRVALLTSEAPATTLRFGPKQEAVSALVRGEGIAGGLAPSPNVTGKDELYRACYPAEGATRTTAAELSARRREGLAVDALGSVIAALRGETSGRIALLLVTDGWRVYREQPELLAAARSRSQDRPGGRPGGRASPDRPRPATGLMLAECEADLAVLARRNHTQQVRALHEQANRALVSVYGIWTPALVPGGGASDVERGSDADTAARQDSLRQLAVETGARPLLSAAAIESFAARLHQDLESYYLLAYRSTNTSLDGRFRRVQVRVLRPGVVVQTRRGYRGPTAAELLAARTPGSLPTDSTAAPSPANLTGSSALRTSLSVWNASGADGAAAWLVGEVDYALRTQLAWTAGAEAHVRIVAGDGGTVLEQVLPVAAADGAFSVRVPARGGLPQGEYAVQVQLRSLAGTAPPLVDTLRLVVSGRTTALGEPVFWRRGPSTATRYIMTATPRFQRNERLRVEFASAVDGQASARLLDRLGNPLQVPVQAGVRDGADGVRWVVADVVLAPLAPGEYAIAITLAGATGRADFRVVP